MKKLFLAIFALCTLCTLNLRGMIGRTDNEIRADINDILYPEMMELAKRIRSFEPLKRYYLLSNNLIEDILSAKNEGRLEDISPETISAIQDFRDEILKSAAKAGLRDRLERILY